MPAEKVLIVGIDSVIGRALGSALDARGYDVIGTTRRTGGDTSALFLDLAQDITNWQPPAGVSVAVLVAAADQQGCIRDPAGSRRVNVDNTLQLSRRLIAVGARIVFPSTNLVFACDRPSQAAGSEYRPLNEYAAQKIEVEQRLLESGGAVSICRLAKLLTAELPLMAAWLRDLAARQPIMAFSDLNIAPVSLGYTAEFLARVIARKETGVLQISGAEELTYCDFARGLARSMRLPAELILCRDSHAVGVSLPAAPRHPSLDASRTKEALGLAPQPVQQVLDEIVKLYESRHAVT